MGLCVPGLLGVVAEEQVSEVCFRGSGRGANQSIERSEVENPDAIGLSPAFTKNVKVGQPLSHQSDAPTKAREVGPGDS